MQTMPGIDEYLLVPDTRMPWVLELRSSAISLEALVLEHATALRAKLLTHGALLFRGFAVHSVEDFQRFADALSEERLDYLYRSTPRRAVGDRIFSATEYPAPQEIPMHNELAYHREWPLRIAFCCLIAAESGGETPIADMRAVTASIPSAVLESFAAREVGYIRHYRPFVDLSWQDVFQTRDVAEVAAYCTSHGIEHRWIDETLLRTEQRSQGVALHPSTGERVFFNQAHLFHVSSLEPEAEQALIEAYGRDRLPRHARFGDGGELPRSDLDQVRAAFRAHRIAFPWQRGDVLLLDNMQAAHGRRPFTGKRQVVAALMDQVTPRTYESLRNAS